VSTSSKRSMASSLSASTLLSATAHANSANQRHQSPLPYPKRQFKAKKPLIIPMSGFFAFLSESTALVEKTKETLLAKHCVFIVDALP
ncbi:MAG: hypothetical protein K2H92_09455, partial [Bacteroidaceae bacterium]|nr:hypothetical protein [Bacteroidaceae bacterium]